MNPLNLSASDMLIWGIVLHLIADWPLQNDWMANNKMKRHQFIEERGVSLVPNGMLSSCWWIRHPAAYVHSSIHGFLLSIVFGWVAIPLMIVHLIIDCRWPVEKWSKLMKQTQPQKNRSWAADPTNQFSSVAGQSFMPVTLYDMGIEVRIWTDQVFHIICIAVAALLVHL